MIGAIVLTSIITSLSMIVFYMTEQGKKIAAENARLTDENRWLKKRISRERKNEQCRKERRAYDQGLYDGRQTDALYRNILKRYSVKDHADIMMNGEKKEGNQ